MNVILSNHRFLCSLGSRRGKAEMVLDTQLHLTTHLDFIYPDCFQAIIKFMDFHSAFFWSHHLIVKPFEKRNPSFISLGYSLNYSYTNATANTYLDSSATNTMAVHSN